MPTSSAALTSSSSSCGSPAPSTRCVRSCCLLFGSCNSSAPHTQVLLSGSGLRNSTAPHTQVLLSSFGLCNSTAPHTQVLLQQKCEAVRGDKDAAETGWVSEQELAAATPVPTGSITLQPVKPADCQGKAKKHSCNSVGMGLKVCAAGVSFCAMTSNARL